MLAFPDRLTDRQTGGLGWGDRQVDKQTNIELKSTDRKGDGMNKHRQTQRHNRDISQGQTDRSNLPDR